MVLLLLNRNNLSLARIVWDCAQDTIYNSIAVVVDCDVSVKMSVLLYKARTGFDAQHVKNLYFVTKLQIRFRHFRGTPRSCSDQTFCKGPVSNYNMTLWTGLFGSDTQLTLLIYCLVYGPLKWHFGPLKPDFWSKRVFGPYFRRYPNLDPPKQTFWPMDQFLRLYRNLGFGGTKKRRQASVVCNGQLLEGEWRSVLKVRSWF